VKLVAGLLLLSSQARPLRVLVGACAADTVFLFCVRGMYLSVIIVFLFTLLSLAVLPAEGILALWWGLNSAALKER
jgi:hypothetical protein